MIPRRQLLRMLRSHLSESALTFIPHSYDIVGDILITDLGRLSDSEKQHIGRAYLDIHPKIRTVASPTGRYEGPYRTRTLQVIAGNDCLDTMHRENGVRLKVNPGKVYFSPRMGGERLRLSKEIIQGERIAVLCSGIAPLLLVLAKNSEPGFILGIEKNPQAHAFARENVSLNKMDTTISLLCGDAETLNLVENRDFDRVITMLPTAHTKMIAPAIHMLRPGGTLHHYAMVREKNHAEIAAAIHRACTDAGRSTDNLQHHRCGHCGPRTYRCCFRAVINPHFP